MIQEINIQNYPRPVSIEGTIKILNQMKNCICKIYLDKGRSGTGFFCYIPFNNKMISALITNNHVLDSNYLKENRMLNISINDEALFKKLKIEDDRNIYSNEAFDITIIELKKEDGIVNYLELDDNLLKENSEIGYQSKTIYNLFYNKEGKACVSYGILKEIPDFNLIHLCSTEKGSSGSPILNMESNKVIGIHKEGFINFNFNKGTFLKNPIEEFKNNVKFKLLNKNLDNILEKKEINLFSKKDNLIKKDTIIFKKYKVIKKIYSGSFSDIYLGINLKDNKYIVIKKSQDLYQNKLLESESYLTYILKGYGIPEVLSFGKIKNFNVLVEPYLGKSLNNIFIEQRKRITLIDICLISIQIIQRIEWVHTKDIIHRDIKPDNFLIGYEDQSIIYLIDFGLSKKYRSSKTGKHRKFSLTGKFIGTLRFASINALRGAEQSRRDDLESIGYMIIYFMKGRLPWDKISGKNIKEINRKIILIKKSIHIKDLCKDLPAQIFEYMKYVRQLKFSQTPDYNYLINLFKDILKKLNYQNQEFSWIHFSQSLNDSKFIYERRESPKNRLNFKVNLLKKGYSISNRYESESLSKNSLNNYSQEQSTFKNNNLSENFVPTSSDISFNENSIFKSNIKKINK